MWRPRVWRPSPEGVEPALRHFARISDAHPQVHEHGRLTAHASRDVCHDVCIVGYSLGLRLL